MNNNQDPRRTQNGYSPLGEPQVKRTYTPEEAGHDRHRKPVSRFNYMRRRRKRTKINIGVVLCTLIFALIIGTSLFFIIPSLKDAQNSSTTGLEENAGEDKEKPGENKPAGEGNEAGNNKDDLPYMTLTLSEEDMHKGELILVNSYTEYFFPEELENSITGVRDMKNEYYKMSQSTHKLLPCAIEAFNMMTEDYFNETGFASLQLNSCYRSRTDQENLYKQYSEERGEDYAKAYVANPGESEHHTGLAMDLNVNVNGYIYYVESYSECAWFRENASEYGFILRYPDDKVYKTGINYESWHYRYVGIPHAQIMEDQNLCLEEYLEDYIVSYTYDTLILGYSENGGVQPITADEFTEGYAIYYVPAEDDMTTEVKIPKECEYTVSGNNFDGYIITCKK